MASDGEMARDDALAAVMLSHKDWSTAALHAAARYVPLDWKGTSEDMNALLLEKGLRPPEKPNAWGAFMARLLKSGAYIKVGYEKMKKKSSHARETRVYRKVRETPYGIG
jgi:hypothetical protein